MVCGAYFSCGFVTLFPAGDYDGDIAEVYWDSSVVSTFTNAQLVEHASLDQKISSNTGSVSDLASFELDVKLPKIHDVLLDSLQDTSVVGIYAGLQDFAVYTKGYDNPETMYLGRMLVEVYHEFESALIKFVLQEK
jgi:hypothetical protein